MIVTLKRGCRIIGFTPSTWQAVMSDPLCDSKRRVADGRSLQTTFNLALQEGMVEPGQPLDFGSFNAAVREAAGRIGSLRVVRLAEGYWIEYAAAANGPAVGRMVFSLYRDRGHAGGHRAKLAECPDAGKAIEAAAWHAAFRENRCVLTAPQVGPHLLEIVHRLLSEGDLQTAGEPAAKVV